MSRSLAPYVLGAAAVASLLSAGAASADVARLQVSSTGDERGPATVRIVVTPASGPARTLGPFTTKGVPGGLLASPDGRHLLVLPYDDGNGGGIPLVVPVAGGPATSLGLPGGIELARPVTDVTWSPDGGAVVIGDSIRTDPDAGAATSEPDASPLSAAALTCPAQTLVCGVLPGPAGSAVGVPGGVLVSSSLTSLLPAAYLLSGVGDEPPEEWTSPTSPMGRLIRGVDGDRRESVTHVEGRAPRVVGRFDGPASDGLPYTFGLVGGPSGAVALRYTITTRLRDRAGKVALDARTSDARQLVVRADGTGRTGPVPRVRIARRDLRGNHRTALHGPQVLRVVPALGRPEGGWISFAVDDQVELVGHEALATTSPDGRAHLVRTGGRAATAASLVDALPRTGRPLLVSGFRLDGYERATRSAVVTVQWVPRGRPATSRARSATLRVPLEAGGRPTVVRGGADAAW